MQTLSVVCLVFLCAAISEVLSQLPPLAGGAQSPLQLIGSTPTEPPQKYVWIQQTEKREWEALGSTFTIELWLWADAPPSNADLNWTRATDEMQFWDVLSRHPGLNYGNEWAHFNLQVTRTLKGATLVFWSGCGCSTPLSQRDDSSCGFAYLLASDWPSLPPSQRFYLKPKSWHHVAITVDGDSLSQGYTTGQAKMYIDGKLIFQNNYADPSNNPPYRVGPVCRGRPIFSQTVAGTKTDVIRLGYYNNQDVNPNTNNPDYVFGFFGYLDEIRIWDVARTPWEIEDNWYLIVDPQPNLVAEYSFNDPLDNTTNTTYPNDASYDGHPVAVVDGPQAGNDTSSPNNGLIISQFVVVAGSDRGDTPTHNPFTLVGSSPTGYIIQQFSDVWNNAIQAGDAILLDPKGEPIRALPHNVSTDPLIVIFYCNDQNCSNMPTSVQDTWLEYSSLEVPTTISYVYFIIQPTCYVEYDACGICGGDNRTCQCVIYHDFRNTRMAYILLTWSLERIVEEIDRTVYILESIESILMTDFDFKTLQGNYTLAAEVSYMMDFYNLCLSDYCADVTEFVQTLDSYLMSSLPSPPQLTTRDVASREINTKASRYIQTSQ